MRKIKVSAAVFVVLLLLASGVFWLFYTPAGVHFLLGSISRFTSAKISATDVRGHLAAQVSISGLKIRLPETTLTAARVTLACRPGGLLFGRLDVTMLSGENVEIMRTGPKEKQAISFIPPHVPRYLAALDGSIRTLRIDNLRYGYPSDVPMFISRISGRAEWHRGELSVRDLRIGSPAGQISGRLDVGFYRPSLRSELWIDTSESWGRLNKFLVRTNVTPLFARAATMAGVISAWAYEDSENRVTLQADLSASRHKLNIRQLQIIRSDHEGVINVRGHIAIDKTPSFTASALIEHFRLPHTIPMASTLTGKVSIGGTVDSYEGRFSMNAVASDWRTLKMDGEFKGDRQHVAAEIPSGEWLGGRLHGRARIDWEKDFQMTGALNARGLNTGLIDKTWQGLLNADASFSVHGSASGISAAAIKARLLDSMFREQPVKGIVEAVYEKGIFRLTELALKGRGFDVSAQGTLAERMNFHANIQDLSSLIPGGSGVLAGQGWLRHGKSRFAMSLSAVGKAMHYEGVRVGRIEVSATIDQTTAKGLDMEATAHSINYAGVDLNTLRVVVKGRLSNHQAHLTVTGPSAKMQATLVGGYEKGVWNGSVKELKGSDRQRGEWRLDSPSALTVSGKRIYLQPSVLHGGRGERIAAAIDLHLKPIQGFVKAEWQKLDLSHLDPLLPVSLSMRVSGHILLQWAKGIVERFSGEATSQGGEVRYRGCTARVSHVQAGIDWTAKGLKGVGQVVFEDDGGPHIPVHGARAEARLWWTGQGLLERPDAQPNKGGLLQVSATSTAAPRMGLPDTAVVSARWSNIDLGLIKPLLPEEMEITGQMAGSLDCNVLADRNLAASIETSIKEAGFTWRTEQGSTRTTIRNATLKATWKAEGIRGQMDLELAEQGKLRTSFLLPILGHLPARAVPSGPLEIRVDGKIQEEGMLSAFFPGLVQETKGSITINAQVLGTWREPRFTGSAQLSNAAAYLPSAGIRIQTVSAKIAFSRSGVDVQEFHAESGPGRIDGSGVISFKDGHIEKYSARLSGDRFQAIYLPDLRLLVSPSLTISGTGKKVVVEGEIRVPQLLVYGPPTEDVVRPSADVVIVGAREKPKRKLPVELQAKVRVTLGDGVQVRMQGIDAKLDGAVALNVNGMDDVSGVGEITLVKGRYRTYGVELQVTRGRITFAGPLQRGRLDILAVRKIEGVSRSAQITDRLVPTTPAGAAKIVGIQPSVPMGTATETQTVGVQITGILERPRVSLYSRPPLSDPDTLSYMVLGRPVSGDAAQASLLFTAAGALLGRGEAGSVQEQLKRTLGLQTIEIATENIATQQGQVEQTLVRVGRYLAPNLYIGFGRSLFTNEYVITARYSLSKKWEIQTRTGAQTGGDIYYKVEFD